MNHLDRVVMNALEGMPNDEYVPGEEIGECCMLVYNNQPMIRFLVLHWLIEHDDRCPVCGVWCGTWYMEEHITSTRIISMEYVQYVNYRQLNREEMPPLSWFIS